jgi:hypothetical protein
MPLLYSGRTFVNVAGLKHVEDGGLKANTVSDLW